MPKKIVQRLKSVGIQINAVLLRNAQIFPSHINRWQQIIIADAFIGRIHPNGDGNVRLQTVIQSYHPPRRTGQRGGVAAQDNGNPQFIIELEQFRVFVPCCRRAQGLNLLNHRRDDFRVLLAQPAD